MFHATSPTHSNPTLSQISSLASSPDSQNNFDLEDNVSLQQNSFSENMQLESSLSDDLDDMKGKSKRFFSPNAVKILKSWFYQNSHYPYPDDNTCLVLALEAKISTKQVRKWFANKRVRSNRCFKQIYRNKKVTEINHLDGSDMQENFHLFNVKFNEDNNATSSPIHENVNKKSLSSIINDSSLNMFQPNNLAMELNETVPSDNKNHIKESDDGFEDEKEFNSNNNLRSQLVMQYLVRCLSPFWYQYILNNNQLMNNIPIYSNQSLNEDKIIKSENRYENVSEYENFNIKSNSLAQRDWSHSDSLLNYSSSDTSINISQSVSKASLNFDLSHGYYESCNENQPLKLTRKSKINFARISDLIN